VPHRQFNTKWKTGGAQVTAETDVAAMLGDLVARMEAKQKAIDTLPPELIGTSWDPIFARDQVWTEEKLAERKRVEAEVKRARPIRIERFEC
jgi:hypothetical protein